MSALTFYVTVSPSEMGNYKIVDSRFPRHATLAATLSELTDGLQRFTDTHLRMRADLTPEMWKAATTDAAERLCLPEIDHDG